MRLQRLCKDRVLENNKMTKVCSRCKISKSIDEFSISIIQCDSHAKACKVCINNRVRALKLKKTKYFDRQCFRCEKDFKVTDAQIKRGKDIYCSKGCQKVK